LNRKQHIGCHAELQGLPEALVIRALGVLEKSGKVTYAHLAFRHDYCSLPKSAGKDFCDGAVLPFE
jgi:hypothetical protein